MRIGSGRETVAYLSRRTRLRAVKRWSFWPRVAGLLRSSNHRGGILSTAVKAQRGIGSVYGTSRDRPYDRWFRYPAGFSHDALGLAVAAVSPSLGGPIVDPFFGAATVAFALPEGAEGVVGIEAHPLIAELAALKLRPAPGSPDALRKAADDLVTRAQPADPSEEHPLVQRCFDSKVLGELAGLRDALAERHTRWNMHLRWALLGALRDVASVKVGWPYQRPALTREPPHKDPSERLCARASLMADDLGTKIAPPPARVVRGDARTPGAWRSASNGHVFGACISSPPYLNNFDYADATRLELFFLRRAATWEEMCKTVRAGMLTATTQQTRALRARRALATLRRFPRIHSEIALLTDRLAEERARRDRGKEYDQLLPSYFADLARVLTRLHENLAPESRTAWVIGDSAPYAVHVDTPKLVGALAQDIGFVSVETIDVRCRGFRWRTNGTRHQVPLAERLVVFERPA
jgi:hypothetical protein